MLASQIASNVPIVFGTDPDEDGIDVLVTWNGARTLVLYQGDGQGEYEATETQSLSETPEDMEEATTEAREFYEMFYSDEDEDY